MPWRIEKRDGKFCVIKEDGENEGCHDTEDEAKKQLAALYASEDSNRGKDHGPIEMREATLGDVNFPQRIIEVVAVPWEQQAVVEYRGELWNESFERGAFNGVEKRPGRVKANRDHNKERLVGKALTFSPNREEGLVGAIRIAPTPLGDETLTLADEEMLGVSVGFGVRGRDQILDKTTRSRKIRTAYLDHLAFVAEGAYAGAGVVGVRTPPEMKVAANLPRLDTPRLDEAVAWLESRRK